jgi:hypothetical protein
MCLTVPGKIVEISDAADLRFRVGKVDLAVSAKRSVWPTLPKPPSANTFWSTSGSPSASSTNRRRSASSSGSKKWAQWARKSVNFLSEYRDPNEQFRGRDPEKDPAAG